MNGRRITARVLVACTLATAGIASAQKTPPPLPPAVKPAVAPAGQAGMLNVIQTSVDASNRAGAVGETLSFTATLKFAHPPASVAGHTLKFFVDGAAACSGKTDATGLASCAWPIPPLPQGSHPYEARFEGEEPTAVRGISAAAPPAPHLLSSKASKSFLVAKAQVTLELVPMAEFQAGKLARIRADLRRKADKALLPPVPMTFTINGRDAVLTLEANGTVYSYPIPGDRTGPLKFEAFYAGNASTNATSAQLLKQLPYNNSAFPTKISLAPMGTVSIEQGSNAPVIVTLRATLSTQIPPPSGPWENLAGATIRFYACEHATTGNHDWICSRQIGFAITNLQGVASQTVGQGVTWTTNPVAIGDHGPDRSVHVRAVYAGDPLHASSETGGDFTIHTYTMGKSPI